MPIMIRKTNTNCTTVKKIQNSNLNVFIIEDSKVSFVFEKNYPTRPTPSYLPLSQENNTFKNVKKKLQSLKNFRCKIDIFF